MRRQKVSMIFPNNICCRISFASQSFNNFDPQLSIKSNVKFKVNRSVKSRVTKLDSDPKQYTCSLQIEMNL